MIPTEHPLPAAEPSGATATRYVVRVRFGETDLMGIVHHATHLLWFEAGRVEYLHRRGLDYTAWMERGVHLPVVEVNVRYRRPARFDERLIVETALGRVTRATVEFTYRIVRDDPREELVAEGSTVLACVGNDGVPKRLPADVVALLRSPETHPRPVDRV